jgi:isochorismate synthase
MNSCSAAALEDVSTCLREEPPNDTLNALLSHAFAAHGPSHRTLCMSLTAPLVPAERLLSLPDYQSKTLWSPSSEDEHSGVGAACVLIATGETRFAQIRDRAETLFRELVAISLDGGPVPDPKLVGAFAFQSARVTSALWRDFGDARFVLPRIAYTRRAEHAWLTITASRHELSSVEGRARLAREAAAALESLHSPLSADSPETIDMVTNDDAETLWRQLVTGIRGEIAAGRLEKVVAARRIVLHGTRLPHPARVLERLRIEASGCMRFALSVDKRTFLGASPERLVKRSNFNVWTEAVAGSTNGNDPMRRVALLLNEKERAEHTIVVREIRAALARICESVIETGPEVHQLRHVAHLRTRFDGRLAVDRHVLDLVAQLHPTSAVGGTPRSAALAWLSEHENADRGLYAGPFGAFDRHGNGEFAVAIRSGLLAADGAHLFAGAGIVDGSEARSELRETRWKLRSLLAAVGAD